jgi:hypothetical protein
MNERVHGPIRVPALRIGRTDVGAATALVEDDALTLSVHVDGAERTLYIRFTSIDSIHAAGDDLELVVRDGTRVAIAAAAGSSFSEELLGRCRTLPELTRTLRAFGSRRARPGAPNSARDTGDGEQQRFFAPLLDARRAAAGAQGSDAIVAFNGSSLMLALEQTLKQFAD